jgi:hypothetical protein
MYEGGSSLGGAATLSPFDAGATVAGSSVTTAGKRPTTRAAVPFTVAPDLGADGESAVACASGAA